MPDNRFVAMTMWRATMYFCAMGSSVLNMNASAQVSIVPPPLPLSMSTSAPQSGSVSTPQIISLAGPPNGSIEPLSQPLKYRDRTKPLTLGEISDMQAQKANAELMRKFGYTDIEPIKPKPVATTLTKPILAVSMLSVFGKPDALQAEILVNGVFKRVFGKESLAPGVLVVRVHDKGIDLDIQRAVTSTKKPRKGKPPTPEIQTESTHLQVGQRVEITL